MNNLLFLRHSYEHRQAADAAFREARATALGSERNRARVLARGLSYLARKLRLGWKAKRLTCTASLRRDLSCRGTSLLSEPDMSDRRDCPTSEQVYDADQFVRCSVCWRWFSRSDPLSTAEHRGPLPHPVENPRTAWADEDE
jgi:hypothetical protein